MLKNLTISDHTYTFLNPMSLFLVIFTHIEFLLDREVLFINPVLTTIFLSKDR